MQQTQDDSWPHNDADMEREHASALTEAEKYVEANRAQTYVPEVEYSSGPSAEEMVYVPEAAVPPGTFNPTQKGAMDDELARLRELTAGSKTHEGDTAEHTHTQSNVPGDAETEAIDQAADGEGEEDDEVVRRSIYVGNVDYGATPQELQEHFARCGKIHRVTIMVDKFTGHPKGFAYLEFSDQAAANNALMLANTTLRGRQIKVLAKRKNIAGLSRGRGGRGRGRGAAFFGGMYGMPYGPMGRGGGAMGGGGAYGPKYRGRGGSRGPSGPY